MGEILEYLKERYTKPKTNQALLAKQRVKNSILSVCDTNLVDADDVLTFEVLGTDLQYAVSVIVEEPLKSKYEINQISETLFTAKLREVDLWK